MLPAPFDLSGVTGLDNPTGLWSDGEVLWVLDGVDKKLYGFDPSDGSRLENDDVALDPALVGPHDVWSDGQWLWVSGGSATGVYDYGVSRYPLDGPQSDPVELAYKAADVDGPRGVWSDWVTWWVGDSNVGGMVAYSLHDTGAADAVRVSANDKSLSVRHYLDGWSDGAEFWLLDDTFDTLSALGDSAKDLALDASNTDAVAVWSDGERLWVLDDGSAKTIHVYLWPEGHVTPAAPSFINDTGADRTAMEVSLSENAVDGSAVDVRVRARDLDGNITSYSITGGADAARFEIDSHTGLITVAPGQAAGLGLDFETNADQTFVVVVSVTDGRDSTGTREDTPTADDTITVTIKVADDIDDEPGTVTVDAAVARVGVELTASVTDPDAVNATTNPTGAVTPTSWQWARADSELAADADPGWTDIASADSASYTPVAADAGKWLRVTAGYDDGVLSADTAVLVVGPVLPAPFDLSGVSGLDNPTGLWSDGEVLWVLDGDDKKLYGFDPSDGTRLAARDVTLDSALVSPHDVWSDGQWAWYRHGNLTDGYLVSRYPLDGPQSDPVVLKLDATLHISTDGLDGLWSDGVTMWVADFGFKSLRGVQAARRERCRRRRGARRRRGRVGRDPRSR